MPKITAIICNYDGAVYTVSLLKSLQNSRYHVDEILVVDDCSTDDSITQIRNAFKSITILRTARNMGPGGARNTGLREAKNDYILFLDNDIELDSNAVGELVDSAANNIEHTFFIPRVIYNDKRCIIQKEGMEFHYIGMTINGRNYGVEKSKAKIPIDRLFAFPGVCFLYLRNRAKQILEYDEYFFYTYEDLDYSIRNLLIGNTAMFVPVAEVYHKEGTQGLSYRGGKNYPPKRLFFMIRNRWFFILKNYELITILLLLPINIIIELCLLAFSLAKSKNKLLFFQSHLSLYKALPYILRKRRVVQKTRLLNDKDILRSNHLKFNESIHGDSGRLLIILDRFLMFYGDKILSLTK